MNKWVLVGAGILCVALALRGEQVIRLEGLKNPQGLVVDALAQRVYINEGAVVRIHSLHDGALVQAFGREGNGPGEFRKTTFMPLKLAIRPDGVVVFGRGKIAFFDALGSLRQEIPCHPAIQGAVPLGNGFVAQSQVREGSVTFLAVGFYDQSMTWQHEIRRQEGSFQMGPRINPFLGLHEAFQVEGERIYVDDHHGVIRGFDRQGSLLTTLPNDYPRKKVTEEDREAFMNLLKTDPRTRMMEAEQLRQLLAFPDYFPLIRDFRVDDGRVYVFPYQTGPDGRMTCHVFDATGKRVRTKPCALKALNIAELVPFCIQGGCLYQVVEVEDDAWCLHLSSI